MPCQPDVQRCVSSVTAGIYQALAAGQWCSAMHHQSMSALQLACSRTAARGTIGKAVLLGCMLATPLLRGGCRRSPLDCIMMLGNSGLGALTPCTPGTAE